MLHVVRTKSEFLHIFGMWYEAEQLIRDLLWSCSCFNSLFYLGHFDLVLFCSSLYWHSCGLCGLLLLQWMEEMWKTDPCYASHGINGSLCSIIIYLSEVPEWLQFHTAPAQQHNVFVHALVWLALASSLCCVKIESWCPVLPGRSSSSAQAEESEVKTRTKNLSRHVICVYE